MSRTIVMGPLNKLSDILFLQKALSFALALIIIILIDLVFTVPCAYGQDGATTNKICMPGQTVGCDPPPPRDDGDDPPASDPVEVTFIHGINGSSGSWSYGEDYLSTFLNFNAHFVDYESNRSISSITSNNYQEIEHNSVVIAYSMGGLVAREAVRQGYGNRVGALVTLATPHLGAPVTENVNSAQALGVNWIADLAWGWSVIAGRDFGRSVATDELGEFLNFLGELIDIWGTGTLPTTDMNPGSTFLNQLNANPSATLPAQSYFVYGDEKRQTHWRLAETASTGGNVEDGDLSRAADALAAIYAFNSAVLLVEAAFYQERYENTGSLNAYFQFLRYHEAALAFGWGAYALSYLHQAEFSGVIHQAYPAQEDGVVPIWSQAAALVPESNIRRAKGANHLEILQKNPALDVLRAAMIDAGVPQQ